jgi:cobyrinic acid a,c-diamide synthase
VQIPALVIAGTHSGVGKTTISIALMAAMNRRGMRVQPFKVGPDFIDPTLHARATGRTSRNLDSWMLDAKTNVAIFTRASRQADISVIEGMMGLFDGNDGSTESASTAELAKFLGVPVVLVVDASAMARSAAAMVQGYEGFDADLDVAGIIFNNVAGTGHFEYLRQATEATCQARVLGWLPQCEGIRLPERHLGLVMADEVLDDTRLDQMVSWIEKGIDINMLVDLAVQRSHKTRWGVVDQDGEESLQSGGRIASRLHTRIGVARDQAFCFYYQDNLDHLASLGAEIVEFSPMANARLPNGLDGLYFGGGYPELHAGALAANKSMRDDVAYFADRGAPVYAECGGLMYMTEAIVDTEGRSYPMVGTFPTRARMHSRLAAIGYVEVKGRDDSAWLPSNELARGHEFRYSVIDEMPEHIARRYRVTARGGTRDEGFAVGSVLASYVHLHFGSCPNMALRFVTSCAKASSL